MLSGYGMLRGDGVDIGRVEYKIRVTESRASKRADGNLWGGLAAVEAFTASQTTLVREDNGYEMTIVLTHVSGDGEAAFAVSGPPGPL